LSEFNDAAAINTWGIDARHVTQGLLYAADDLLLRINDTRAFHRAHDAHLARRSWFSSALSKRSDDEVLLQQLTQALRAAPDALTVDPAIWEWGDFWVCFWLCATGQIALTNTDKDDGFAPDAVAYCAIQALVPLARQLLLQPKQRAECEKEIHDMLEGNEDNAITALPTVQYAFDQLGVRRFVETQLAHADLKHIHRKRRHQEDAALTLLPGNTYKFPNTTRNTP
jgi:hypothetical protein